MAQFEDAISTIHTKKVQAIKVAILDGVLYIPNKQKMYAYLKTHSADIILSSLVLREFLYSV